jgi:hypothetical protein
VSLNERQRAIVAKKFDVLRQASFGFTQDRLLHIQEDDLKVWTDACTGELRRNIAEAAPSQVTTLLYFRELRCVSFEVSRFPIGAESATSSGGRNSHG